MCTCYIDRTRMPVVVDDGNWIGAHHARSIRLGSDPDVLIGHCFSPERGAVQLVVVVPFGFALGDCPITLRELLRL